MRQELLDGLLPGINPAALHDADPFPLETEVEVIAPGIYCDVFVGMTGRVVCTYVGGYGVELHTKWNDPHTNGKSDRFGPRILWFRRSALKRKEDQDA